MRELWGALFTLLAGTLLHFTYEWSGKNPLVGSFSATNESTWEHLKLLALPLLVFGAVEYVWVGSSVENFIPVKVLSAFLGMATIVVLFYTYVGIVGRHFLWADIGTFFVGVLVAYWFSARLLGTAAFSSPSAAVLGGIGLLALLVGFPLFTFFPPHIGLFLDPVSRRYGLSPAPDFSGTNGRTKERRGL
ncbi:MAG: DUF6512 family protein [Oscillospiraceae bacterium]